MEIFKRAVATVMSVIVAVWLSIGISAAEGEKVDILPTNEQLAIERMISGFENFAQSIDLFDLEIKPNELTRLFYAATKNSPYLFYVDNHMSYTYRSGGYVMEVIPNYKYDEENALRMGEFCVLEIKKLAEIAAKGESDIERVILAHDLICRRFYYDTTLESNNLYTFLKSGKGTCQGYTWAYMALLRELGIECEYVASDSIVHIWLRVRIGGEWYHSDVTWDDPPAAEGVTDIVSRRHLLFSDKKADADGYVDRYGVGEIACASEKYDDFDFSSISPPCSVEGDINHNGNTDLCDLIRMRLYIEGNEADESVCPICLDLDGDALIDNADLEHQRRLLLNKH